MSKTGMFAEGPHTHKAEEYLMFISSDPKDMKSLGATVEIAFGEKWENIRLTILPSCASPRASFIAVYEGD